MECHEVRSALALWAGHDEFDELGSAAEVRLHLQDCADCRQLRRSLLQSQEALTSARVADPGPRPSLWIAVAPQIARQDRRPRRSLNLQQIFPAALMSVACIIMVAVLLFPRGNSPGTAPSVSSDGRNLFEKDLVSERLTRPQSLNSPTIPVNHPAEPRIIQGRSLPGLPAFPKNLLD